MEVVNTLDIDGTQWEIQDEEARRKIAEYNEVTSESLDFKEASILCVKINKIVNMHISNKVTIPAHSNKILIDKLPKEYFPFTGDFRSSFINNAVDDVCGQIIIRESGQVILYNSSDYDVSSYNAVIYLNYITK